MIVVTGCAGFIGSKTAELLLSQGELVLGIDDLNDSYDAALKRWELAEVGTAFVKLDAEQQRVRMDGRRTLAADLTEALGVSGPRLMWEQHKASYYDIRQRVALVVDGAGEAELATVEITLKVERSGEATLEESLAFNLWRNPDKGWRITGLDKGSAILKPFLDELRGLQ